MSRPRLLDLPNETLGAICSALCWHIGDTDFTHNGGPSVRLDCPEASMRALSTLCSTSRRLNVNATPFLYHTFVAGHQIWNYNRIFYFMETLIERPDLAALVKEAALTAYILRFTWQETFASEENFCAVEGMVRRAGIALPRGWEEAKCRRLADEFLAQDGSFIQSFLTDVFLTLAPNIERLSLDMSDFKAHGTHLPDRGLPCLKALYLSPLMGFNLQSTQALLAKAPQVERLEVSLCEYVTTAPSLTNVTFLKLARSGFARKDLKAIAKACPKLETFIFQYFSNQHDLISRWTPEFTPKKLMDALVPCKQTLRHLELEAGRSAWRHIWQQRDMIPTLREFSALETVVLDDMCVFAVDQAGNCTDGSVLVRILPASIVSFTLSGSTDALYNDIMELARDAKKGLFPRLRTFGGVAADFDRREVIETAFREGGVSLRG